MDQSVIEGLPTSLIHGGTTQLKMVKHYKKSTSTEVTGQQSNLCTENLHGGQMDSDLDYREVECGKIEITIT